MKAGSKKRWHSIMPIPLCGKSETHFCMFPKVKSTDYDPGSTPVYLNVYDLTPVNGYLYWTGLGVFHTGVEGRLCNCMLPEALKASAMRHDTNFQAYDSEKKRLRSSFSCLSSISMHQRENEVSISSLFLHSHYKGCLPPWELKKSRSGSFKEG